MCQTLVEEYVTQVNQNIPEGTVALKEGAQVITADGQHVGKIERIVADLSQDQVTHLLISRGMFPKETKLIPMERVRTMTDDEVYLGVEEHFVDELAEVSISRSGGAHFPGQKEVWMATNRKSQNATKIKVGARKKPGSGGSGDYYHVEVHERGNLKTFRTSGCR